jgi:hypothetical protein
LLAVAEFALVDAEAGSADCIVGRAEDAAAANVRVGRDGHVFEDFAFVPDVVAGGNDVGPEVEEFFGDGGGDTEAPGSVFAVDDEEIDGVGFEDVGEMFADDVAAGGAKDIADKKDVHLKSLHGGVVEKTAIDAEIVDKNGLRRDRDDGIEAGCVSFFAWHRVDGFS